MALHTVTESDSFDTNIQMPADGDPADASDFESSSIRPLTNRSRWLWNKIQALIAWIDGGTITPADDVIIDQSVTVNGSLDVGGVLNASRVRGARRLRVAYPTAAATYGVDDVDMIVVERGSLAAGTTIITIDHTTFAQGDVIEVSIQDLSASRDVRIVYGAGSFFSDIPDDFTGRYTFMRRNSSADHMTILGKSPLS